MGYKKYSEQERLDIVHTFYKTGLPLSVYARNRKLSECSLRRWIAALGDHKQPGVSPVAEDPRDHPMPQFDKRPSNKLDVLDTLRKLADVTKKEDGVNKDYAKIAIETGRPIAVMKAADFHLGGLDVSYDALVKHYEFLLNEPAFYLQLFGDDINMMIVHKSVGARHDALSPNKQCELIESMVDDLLERGKLLSMCWGNHSEDFAERTLGLSIMKLLVAHKVPYFRGMGYIDLAINDVNYPMAFTHATRFHSFMNAVHGNKRMEQMHAEYFTPSRPIAREYITAHTHYPAYTVEGNLPEDRVWFIKCGTFKTDCLYSQRYFGQGRIGVPTVVYHPDRMEHVCFPTPFEAYRYMTGKDAPGLKNSAKK